MPEVASPAVQALIEVARRAGIDVQRALDAIGLAESEITAHHARIPWASWVEFVDALQEASGRPARFVKLAEDSVRTSTNLQALIGLFDQPIDFYRFVTTRFAPALMQPLRATFEQQSKPKSPRDAYRLTVEIAPPYGGSVSMFRLLGGMVRALPHALGLPPAEVKSDVGERRAVYVVRAARPVEKTRRTPRAFTGEQARALFEQVFEDGVHANTALGASRRAVVGHEERIALVHELGRALGHCTEVSELGRSLADALAKPPFGCDYVALSLVDHGAAHAVVQVGLMTPGAPVRVHALRLGDREVARLETTGYDSATRPDALDDLVPWLVLAVDRLLLAQALRESRSTPPPEAGVSDEALQRRLARAGDEWRLTPRQLACVERLVRGRSNREIANDVGCTERTVEAHLAVVFRRAGVRARSSLVARFWSETW